MQSFKILNNVLSNKNNNNNDDDEEEVKWKNDEGECVDSKAVINE